MDADVEAMDALSLLQQLQERYRAMQDRALAAEAACRRLQDELARRGVPEEVLEEMVAAA